MADHHAVHDAIRQALGIRYDSDNLPWAAKRVTRLHLVNAFAALGHTTGVEVGTRYGLFAIELCTRIPGLHLTCVDPYVAYRGISQATQDRIYAAACQTLAPFNVTQDRRPSLEAVKDVPPGSLDFVYIDGDHRFDAVMQDIIQWATKVKAGGIVALHDYVPFRWAGVVEAVNAYTHSHHIDPWYLVNELEPTACWVNP